MVKIEIEHSVPLPKSVAAALRDMKEGDSFALPVVQRSSVYMAARRLKISIITRTVSDNQFRVWRIKAEKKGKQ